MQFRLSEGSPESKPATTPAAPAPATPISDEAAQNLLKRLPLIKTEDEDQKDFALRDRSLPPPRTGQTIQQAFPPPSSLNAPEQIPSGPLEVVRFAPEGEVPLAPHLNVTFSQPMVAVTSNADLEAAEVPIKLTPQPGGKWRWLGTKTLLFAPTDRFPMATNYTVEIPAGTKSINGGALAQGKRWTFATPAPKVTQQHPINGPHRRNPLFFVAFDQSIEPTTMLKHISLQGGVGEWKLRLATAEEVAADEIVNRLVKQNQPGRWLAFRVISSGANADNPLTSGTNFTVTVERGAPSAEGPRTTNAAQSFSFSTYAPLALTEHRCGYDGKCEPGMPWSLQFNNPLDMAQFDKQWIRVEPELPGLKIQANGNWINIEGQSRGRTSYRVTIDQALKDIFGQTLGQSKTVTFNVGSAQPGLAAAAEGLTVLDPFAAPRFSLFSINHQQLKVSLYAVSPEHWGQFAVYMREEQRGRGRRTTNGQLPFGRLISAQTVTVNGQPDDLAETAVDLKPVLPDGFGHVVLIAEAVQPPRNEWERRWLAVWIQVTDIGLDAFVDQNEMLGWASSLKDGKPISDVQLAIAGLNGQAEANGQTGVDGLAKLALPATQRAKMLVARKGKDVALLPENFYWWGEQTGWQRRPMQDWLSWHVFDDRGMYRPGEEVRVKGWLRGIGAGPQGDVMAAAGVTSVNYTLRDARGNEVLKGTAQVNQLGGFDAMFKLPPTMNLGYANLQLQAVGGTLTQGRDGQHLLRVQEFRRPEYEVKAAASEGPHFVRGHATVTVAANYYAGGGLPNAEVNWQVIATQTNYTPPNRGDFIFGRWTPWWGDYGGGDATTVQSFRGVTDGSGKHHLRIDFDSVNPVRATNIIASAGVQDVNRQSISGLTTLLVHPADLYVGLRSARTFVQQGEPLIVESIVTNIDGQLIANREIRMRAALLDWVYDKGEWREQETGEQTCVVRSGNAAVTCRFETKEGGRYGITATILDDRERPNETEMTLWVAGGKQPPQRNVALEKIELIPSRKDYQPGETAELLVQAPFFPAEGVVTLRRAGLVTSERFTMNTASHTLKLPIRDEYTPNVHVQVDLVGASLRTDAEGKSDAKQPKRPAFASGELNLSIPPTRRKLNVTATPRDTALEPGGTTTVAIEVRDAAGGAVSGGEVALIVVDEAVLALSNYQLADPLNTFYQQRGAEVSDHHLREKVQLARADDLISQMRQGGGAVNGRQMMAMDSVAAAPPPQMRANVRASSGVLEKKAEFMQTSERDQQVTTEEPIRARLDFNALAFFAAALPTDANGRASVQVKLPDNLTRYRVMAVAVAGAKQFGTGEALITARLPLMVRPSAPRFLNFGDRFELPVVVQNQTDQPMQVDLAVRATNAQFGVPPLGGMTAQPGGQPPEGGTPNAIGRRVTVPANDRVEVRFPATTIKPGTARFQIAGASTQNGGKWSDAAEVSLPVWTPATTEAFATYGEVDAGAIVQPVKAPSDAIKQFGSLEITTSSTQLQALTDAVIYLANYPYECAEQISSRILAIAALRDVLAAFDAKGLPPADELVQAVGRDLKRLEGMQNGDGGFGFWRRNDESWPYVSIHAAHSLQRAKEKKFDVPAPMLERSQQYLRTVEQRIPHWYSIEARRALIAYALNVRQRMGDRDHARARRLIDEAGGVEKLPLEAVGWLLPVLSDAPNAQADVLAIRRHLNNRAEETAGAAHFTTSYSDGAQVLLHSSRRADGIILEALIGNDPQSDLIPKLVRGLLGHRRAGRWENTQENVFALLALDRYFATYEKVTPNFIARLWLGDAFAGGHEFRGRTTDSHQVNIPMNYLMGLSDNRGSAQNLALSKEGAGRLYYRIGMNYAPTSLQLKAADYGFTVTRVYEAIDNPADVRRDEDGAWRIKAGAQVRVRLTMVAQARRYHVALVDPLPAGLEAMNPELAVTGRIPQDPKEQTTANPWWRWWQWFQHQNMRDERVEAFTSLLWEGVYNYSYVARATTPGNFIVPPTKAEEMYHPETFGRGASDRVIIE